MKRHRYRGVSLVLGMLVLGCNAGPSQTPDKAETSTAAPEAPRLGGAGFRKGMVGRGRPKAIPRTTGPLANKGFVD
jgi:hypothetical protein